MKVHTMNELCTTYIFYLILLSEPNEWRLHNYSKIYEVRICKSIINNTNKKSQDRLKSIMGPFKYICT